MRILKWLLILLIVLIPAVYTVLVYRTFIVQSLLPLLAEEKLHQAGVHLEKLKIDKIGIHQAQISSLIFNLTSVSSATSTVTCQVKIKGVKLQYNIADLLAAHRTTVIMDRITGESIQITELSAAKNITENKNTGKKIQSDTQSAILYLLFKQFQSDWREKIPFKHLHINSLRLYGKIFKGLSNQRISLDFHQTETAEKSAGLSLQLNIPVLSEKLIVTISPLNIININLDQSRTALIHLEMNDKVIKADYRINIQKITKLLQDTGFMDVEKKKLFPGKKGRTTAFVIYPVSGKVVLPVVMLLSGSVSHKHALFTLTSQRVSWRGGSIDHPQANFIVDISTLKKGLVITLHPGSFMRYKKLTIADTQIKNTAINLHGNMGVDSIIKKGRRHSHELSFVFNLTSRSVQVLQKFAAAKPIQIKARNVVLHVTKMGKKIQFKGRFTAAEIPAKFSFYGDHSLRTEQGMLTMDTDKVINLSAAPYRLSQLVKPWPYPADIISGSVALHASMQWWANKPFQLSTRLQVKNAGGYYQQLVFSGLNTMQYFTILPVLQTKKYPVQKRIGHTGLIRLKQLDSGVLISNVHLQLSLKHKENAALPVIILHNLAGHIFGGRFYSRKISLDFNHAVNRFTLKLSDIDLATIVGTQSLPGLSVDGKLDGVLPIELNGQGVYIHHGYFDNAGRKGYIRYQPKTGKGGIATGALSKIVLQALQDFRYSKLVANLSYTPDGSMNATLHLAGISPELGKTQQVKLNINTQQNIRELLKGLRYSQGLDDSIDAAVRKKYH